MADLTFTIVVEQAIENLSAFAPDLPGCVATGKTEAEVVRRMTEAIELHIRRLVDAGEPIPRPQARSREIQIRVPAA